MPLVLAFVAMIVAHDARADAIAPTKLRYEIVSMHAHDVGAFTQGLAFWGDELLESRGGIGASAITLGTVAGAVRKRRDLARAHFGEGVAVAGDRALQLTWQSGRALAYDRELKPVGEFRYHGEGWGLAHDGAHWITSDGSDRLTWRRERDFGIAREVRVRDRGRPVRQLNELEFADGRIYANVWHSDRVAVIDPVSGAVEAWIDFSALRKGFAKPPGWDEREHVLNGLAWHAKTGRWFVTGKCWPVLYEIRLLQ